MSRSSVALFFQVSHDSPALLTYIVHSNACSVFECLQHAKPDLPELPSVTGFGADHYPKSKQTLEPVTSYIELQQLMEINDINISAIV